MHGREKSLSSWEDGVGAVPLRVTGFMSSGKTREQSFSRREVKANLVKERNVTGY